MVKENIFDGLDELADKFTESHLRNPQPYEYMLIRNAFKTAAAFIVEKVVKAKNQ